MSSASPKMTWNGAADQTLLLAILAEHSISVDYVAVANRLGPHCTPRAVQERLKRLRKMAVEHVDEEEVAEATPVKSDGKGGKKAAKKPVQQASEGEAAEASPVKGKGKGKNLVKKSTGPAAKRAKKRGNKEVVIMEDADAEETGSGGATEGTKRKRTDDDEDNEGTDGDENANIENEVTFDLLGGQVDGVFET